MSMMSNVDRDEQLPKVRWHTYLLPSLLAGYCGVLWGVVTGRAWLAALIAGGLLVVTAAMAALLTQFPQKRDRIVPATAETMFGLWRLLLALSLPASSGLILWLRLPAISIYGHLLNAAIALLVGLLSARTLWHVRQRPAAPRPAGLTRRPEPGRWHRLWLRSGHFWLSCLVVSSTLLLTLTYLLPPVASRVTLSYTGFKQHMALGNIAEITEYGETQRGLILIKGRFVRPAAEPASPPSQTGTRAETFETTVPPFIERREIGALLDQHQVPITARLGSDVVREQLTPVVLAVLPVTIMVLALFLLLGPRSGRDGLLSLGRSRARRYGSDSGQTPITFADVAGVDEAKEEVVELVDFLKYPEKYQRLGGTMPKGVLLIGPPGTGKTLLARAVAGEADAPFFSISGSEFVEVYVGVGASRVRDLFAQARKAAPAIVFIDELDAIGQRRGGHTPGRNDEREQTLNQILVEMDGFDAGEPVIVIAATNRSDVLDPALLRPGRFDRHVTVHPPDRAGREAILTVHTRGVPLAPNVYLARVAAQTPGLVGADLRNLVNEAALLAARKGRDMVTGQDFAAALEKIALGPERRIVLAPEERERVAYHESGHALLGLLQPESDPVRRVTVVPRGQALGVTISVPENDRYNYSEAYVRARIVTTLGGRAAEQVVYGNWTTGAENDLKQATTLARAMVTRWGMSPEVGMVALSNQEEGNFVGSGGATTPFSERTACAVDDAIRRIIEESYAKAIELLTQERVRLEALTQALLREEALDEEQMLAATGLARKQDHAVDPANAAD